MTNLWKNDFQEKDIITPKDIIEEQCENLNSMTDGKIIGRIISYDGEIRSYSKPPLSSSALAGINRIINDGSSFDVQTELGEITEDDGMTYEFYITSRKTPNYKYRAFFIQYGLAVYPTYISMDQMIADELQVNSETVCDNEEEFIDMLGLILNSSRVVGIVENLLSFNKDY